MSEDFPARLTGFRAGSSLAGYRLEAQIGAGGMAVVFRARDERLGRPVALKILAPEMASGLALRRRFIAESQAAAAVDDPHIIPVYEAGEDRPAWAGVRQSHLAASIRPAASNGPGKTAPGWSISR